jgi:hypothetical protein
MTGQAHSTWLLAQHVLGRNFCLFFSIVTLEQTGTMDGLKTKITKHKVYVTAVKKALKSVREREARQQKQNGELLCAIKRRDPTQVRACVANGAQADGEDENGHTFMMLADSAYGYDASREQHLDDMYRILASASLNPRKPRIIEVSGSFFNVHDPSPTHSTGDLGALPDFIEGDDNFGKMETHAAGSKPSWIDRDPKWFSTILDLYHMGEHMPMPELQLRKLQDLGDLLREVKFYAIDGWLKAKIEREYKHKAYVEKLLQKAKMLLPFLFSVLQPYMSNSHRSGSYDVCEMKVEVDGITPPRGLWSYWEYQGTADRLTEAICIAVQKELSWTLTLYLTVQFNGTGQQDRDRWAVEDDLESNERTYRGLAQFDYQHLAHRDRDYDKIVITGYDLYTWGIYIDLTTP